MYIELSEKSVYEHHCEIIKYACMTSTKFAIIRAWETDDNCLDSKEMEEELLPYLMEQITDKSKWLPYSPKSKNDVLLIYSCIPRVRKILQRHPDACWLGNYMEKSCFADICFYRGKNIWLAASNHENLISFVETVEDLAFFKSINVLKKNDYFFKYLNGKL